jgi:type II secretory pathway pseudopilin PulG
MTESQPKPESSHGTRPDVTQETSDPPVEPAPPSPPQQSSSSQAVPKSVPTTKHAEAARRSAADVWRLKELEWPPDDETRPVVRIITQNENGPCGLIALCE